MLDVTTEWGKHAEQRLQSNSIACLTTVGGGGRPYTVPVGFVWEGQIKSEELSNELVFRSMK